VSAIAAFSSRQPPYSGVYAQWRDRIALVDSVWDGSCLGQCSGMTPGGTPSLRAKSPSAPSGANGLGWHEPRPRKHRRCRFTPVDTWHRAWHACSSWRGRLSPAPQLVTVTSSTYFVDAGL